MYSTRSAVLAGPLGPDWLYMVIDPDPAAHMIVNFFQNYMTEAGERQPQEWRLWDGLGHGRVCDDPQTPPPPHSQEF